MDDKGTLRFAMDCALIDPQVSTNDDGASDIPLPVRFEASPPGEGEPATIQTSAEADDESPAALEQEDAGAASVVRIIEALLFSSDTALSAVRLADLVEGCTPAQVRKHIEALNEKYQQAGLSFRIKPIARGYQMMTLPDFAAWVARLNKQRSETRLSAAALETLSIIAYKQPIIRADVEAIRGVACGEVISRLRDMGLIRVLGRAEVVGRPLLYGTTRRFLDTFGLADLDDLPPMEALRLKSGSKPAEEVEPVKPPPLPERPLEQCAVAGT